MLDLANVHELSEIGIDRDQDPAFGSGTFEQCLITRILSELPRLKHVMALIPQPVCQTAADATVDEELHGSATDTADSVSLAITACA